MEGMARTTFEGFRTTTRTVAMLKEARRLYKKWGGHGTIGITQGGYNGTAVAASAGTHARDCLDLSIRFMSSSDKKLAVKALRTVGFAAWHRYYLAGVWPEHCHAVPKGGDLARGAANQVTSFRNGRNGLVGNARDSSIGSFAKVTWESYSKAKKAADKKTAAKLAAKAAELARKNQTDTYVAASTVKKLARPAEYWVATGTLQGLHVSRKPKAGTLRKKGYHVVVSKLIYRWGRWNAVTSPYETYYAIKDSKQTYLTAKNPKPVAKPAPAPAATVPVSTSGLSPWAAKYWPAMADRFEGTLEYCYADVLGLVTCGVGNLIDSVSAAQALPWLTKDNKPASTAEVAAEWSRVKKYATTKVKDLPGAKGSQLKDTRELRQLSGRAFKPYTTLHLSDAAVAALLTKKTAEFIARFVKDEPGWSTWDPAGQLAAMDLMWQNGPAFTSVKNSKGAYVWPNMRAAFLTQDWARAAKAVPGTATSARRLERVRLFTNAAKSKAATEKTKTVLGSVVAGAVVALAASAGQAASTPPPVKPPVASTPSASPTPAVTAKPSPSAAPTVIDCASGCHITITNGS